MAKLTTEVVVARGVEIGGVGVGEKMKGMEYKALCEFVGQLEFDGVVAGNLVDTECLFFDDEEEEED